ncbi:hypothetical protein BG005_006707 [Podila minutissima]|nr:hypothetical protein BG005_006707 [Podila minutissima]
MYIVFGPVWAISLPEIGPMIQGDSPEIVEHVLNSIFRAYDKGLILKGDMDIFGSDGTRWRFQRKLASHIFTVRAFKEYVSEVFVNEGYKVIKYLGNAADQDTVSFGKSFGCLENIEREVPFAARSTVSMPLAPTSLSTQPGGFVSD